MEPHISLLTLGVADVDRSIRFYRDGLGFPMRERDGAEPVAFFTLSGTWLGVYPRDRLAEDAGVTPDDGGFAGVTIAHNVGSTRGVDAVVAEADDAGATVVKPPAETEWGGYAGYFADPDGYLWEVAWNPQFTPGEPDAVDRA